MEDLSRFVALILWNFWTVLAGIMLGFEPVTRWFFSDYDNWASRFLTPDRRKYSARALALVAFVIANYIAFHDLSETNRSLQSELQKRQAARHSSPYYWEPLSEQERLKLRDALRAIPARPIAILCNEGFCTDLSVSLGDVVMGLGWDLDASGAIGKSVPGITVRPDDDTSRSIVAAIERATSGRLLAKAVPALSKNEGTTIAIGRKN